MATFADRFKPRLDRLRTRIPSDKGIRTVTLTVRTQQLIGNLMTGGQLVTTDKAITGPNGARYKVKDLSTREIMASGGQYQAGSIRVGPITPPYPGGAWTRVDLLPASTPKLSVLYGITDSSGQTQWCQMAEFDGLNDLHWSIILNPTGTSPEDP